MKKLLMMAILGVTVAGCETNELLQPPAEPLRNSQTRGDVTVAIADTLYGSGSLGRCDMPLSVLSFANSQGAFTGGRVIFTKSVQSDTFAINASQMADVIDPIPSFGGAFGTLYDSEFGSTFAPPYNGALRLDWTIGGSNYSATLNFLCL